MSTGQSEKKFSKSIIATTIGVNAGTLGLLAIQLILTSILFAPINESAQFGLSIIVNIVGALCRLCTIGLFVLTILNLINIESVKQKINPKHFRIMYGVGIGLYAFFEICGLALVIIASIYNNISLLIGVDILGGLQVIILIVSLIYIVGCYKKLKTA